jgi:hypothetical protein
MSQENKTVFHVIREKAAAKVAVALLAAALLAGAGLAYPPGPSAPVAVADFPPGPSAPANA